MALSKIFASLSGLHGTFGSDTLFTVAPPGLGADWSSQTVMPSQNVGWSWKLKVPPVPS